ncbi:class I SAM-dependent methyltransferase [Pararhizobium arenae]|uniref:class I SAM-dependent methyltransferase n=1 Tax=Pararhizobium arenae TaxID=1856850 RepID=UPI00094AF094|nr:methyltransferase [Pararhizobium arenae]
MKTDPEAFILENTDVLVPPHVPEIRLYLATEAHDLWLKTEEELQEIGLPPPFWAFAWAGGQGLARYVLDHPDQIRGRDVIDFAAGSGLVGIAAAKIGAASVLAADIDPWAETAVRLNATLNGVDIAFTDRNIVGEVKPGTVLLAGDVFYDKGFADALIPWFSDIVQHGGTVLVGDPGRSYCPRHLMQPLDTYEVPVTRALEDGEVKRTTVWRFGGLTDA